jgi:sugar lactone lactonase YvrE
MHVMLIAVLTFFLGAWATVQSRSPAVSILVDLDPASADRTVIVESTTADKEGRLYLPDRVTGNILRADPRSPKSIVVGRIEAREIKEKKVNVDPSGIAFNPQGDLFVAVGLFSEVVRIRGAELNPAKPGVAQTFATGTAGANGIVFDREGKLFVAGGPSGIVYRIAPSRGAAQPAVQIDKHTRTLSDGKTQQAIVFVGDTAYIANYDTPRRDNMDANGKTALDGIGASIARITP